MGCAKHKLADLLEVMEVYMNTIIITNSTVFLSTLACAKQRMIDMVLDMEAGIDIIIITNSIIFLSTLACAKPPAECLIGGRGLTLS